VVVLRWFDIIFEIVTGIKWIVHVGGKGWRRVTLMAARMVMTSRHDDRDVKEGEGERRDQKPRVVVVVVVVSVEGRRALQSDKAWDP